jgi:5-methylcytosine-specific restriction endonuclease McrBC regulatory subunit McrC
MIRLRDNCHDLALSGMELAKGRAKMAGAPATLTLGRYLAGGNRLFSFHGVDAERRGKRNGEDELIVAVKDKAGDGPVIQTGNYVGRFTFQKLEFDIASRFGDAFMQRMLNFANDIYVDDGFTAAERVHAGETDYARALLFMMFVQALEKAFLLGLPKAYRSVAHHGLALRGRIDIPRFVRHDLPFTGKVSTVAREQMPSQPIIDVLNKAITVINSGGAGASQILQRIAHVRTHLGRLRSHQPVGRATTRTAKADKALLNPVFAPYRKVLELAEMIIELECARESIDAKTSMPGFLVNVADLFEIYVGKLLARHFPEWRVGSPAILLHTDRFYQRNIIPDIVMEHADGRRIAVLDTKYKRMHFRGRGQYGMGDVDREDFFQIATYMGHFKHLPGKSLVLGGLLYPLAAQPQAERCYDRWMRDPQTSFIVDGIVVPEADDASFADVVAAERKFVDRLAQLLGEGL